MPNVSERKEGGLEYSLESSEYVYPTLHYSVLIFIWRCIAYYAGPYFSMRAYVYATLVAPTSNF